VEKRATSGPEKRVRVSLPGWSASALEAGTSYVSEIPHVRTTTSFTILLAAWQEKDSRVPAGCHKPMLTSNYLF
jgi:hypothetical protein